MAESYIAQAAAIPYRRNQARQLEVLLIRRKCGGDWSIPKGHVDPGYTHEEAAAVEAIEEAGIEGEILSGEVGEFTYGKSGGTCKVRVFIMKVTHVHDRWLEQSFRERDWFPVEQAAELAGRIALKSMIRKLPAHLQK